MLKKILGITAICTFLFAQSVQAKKLDLDSTIKNSELNKTSTIAVSVRNAQTGEVEYEYNQNKLLHPASVLKLITLPVSLDALTPEYKYETKFALDKNNNLYIKLSADPSLTSNQLKQAIANIPKKELNNLYIDDKVLDRYEWGIGWMWDDETNPRMAKFSPYNLNQNVLNVKVSPTTPKQQAQITPLATGTATVMNMVVTGNKNELFVYRQNSISPNLVYLYGTVSTPQLVKIPIGNPERFFLTNLTNQLKARNISHLPPMLASYPKDAKAFYTIENGITDAIAKILQNSDNFYAETLFKTAAGVKANDQGTFDNSIKMFENYYKKYGLDTRKVILADGSGVSRNNLFSTDWISEALYKIQKDKNFSLIKEKLPAPTTGTMKNRLEPYAQNLKAKTGTLANTSTIAGYLTDKSGEEHILTIFVANFIDEPKKAQELQDKIITEIYNK